MEVSIIIPVGSDIAGLEATLQSIAGHRWDPERVEVIVCNDGGGDVVANVIREFGCIEARLDENQGSYTARNAGIRVARGRALAFLDADEQVEPGWLAAGIASLECADYVGGRVVVDPGPNPGFWKRVDATFAFPVASYLDKRRYAPTANLFVRREVFDVLGGFHEALRSGGDLEFGVRVADAGFVQRYCELAVTRHPARGLGEQLRKIRRTSEGYVNLEVVLWGRSAIGCAARAMLRVAARLCQAALFALRHLACHMRSRQQDAHLLAAGHALMKARHSLSMAAFSAALVFRRRRLQSQIPPLARVP